jgi:hypothetical protein
MATEFYIESKDRPAQSGIANAAVVAGELVFDDGSGVDPMEFADGDFSGVAEYSEEFLSADDIDAIADEEYQTGDRVIYGGAEDAAVIKVRTPEDNSTDPAPSIGHGDIVGVVDETSTVASAAEFEGRVVQEGYTDDAATTYNRGNSNFLAIGRAYRPAKQNGDSVTDFDTPVRLVVFGEVKED